MLQQRVTLACGLAVRSEVLCRFSVRLRGEATLRAREVVPVYSLLRAVKGVIGGLSSPDIGRLSGSPSPISRTWPRVLFRRAITSAAMAITAATPPTPPTTPPTTAPTCDFPDEEVCVAPEVLELPVVLLAVLLCGIDDDDDGSELFGQCENVLLLFVAWVCSASSRVYSLMGHVSRFPGLSYDSPY